MVQLSNNAAKLNKITEVEVKNDIFFAYSDDERTGLYELRSVQDGRSVAANAYFVKDDIKSGKSFFILLESGGNYSISVHANGKDKYMIKNNKFPMMTDQISRSVSYLYKLKLVE